MPTGTIWQKAAPRPHPSRVQQAQLQFPQKLWLSWGLEQARRREVGGFCRPQARALLSELQLLLASEAPLLPQLLAGHGHRSYRGLANSAEGDGVAYCWFLFLHSLKSQIAAIAFKCPPEPFERLSKLLTPSSWSL